jgi:outer membrane receptor for ferrienterochelin and colicin
LTLLTLQEAGGRLALGILLAVAPAAVRAQPAAPDPSIPVPPIGDITELSLEQLLNARITTASRTSERANEAPATVYVISRNDIRARGYFCLADVLRDLPGMETVEQYYSEQGTLVPVRGVVGNNKIVLLINGMRVNPPGGEELMLRNDLSVRFAEQIEVIYGPGSTLYGQDAISAVINIKTGHPTETSAEALAAYGLHDTREVSGAFGTRLDSLVGPVALSGHLSLRSSDFSNFKKSHPDWWVNHEAALAPRSLSTEPVRGDTGFNVFGRLETTHASLQAWYRDSERSSAEGSGEGGKSPVLFFVDQARWRDRSLAVEGQYNLRLAERLTLSGIFTFNRYEVHPESRYVFPATETALFYNDFKYGVGTGVSIEEKVDWSLSDSTHLIFGAMASNYDIVPKSTVPGGANRDLGIVSQAGALTYFTGPGSAADDPRHCDPTAPLTATGLRRCQIDRATDLHYQQYGVYAEGSHRFSAHFRAIAGVRVDLHSRFDDIPVSPRAAVVWNSLGNRLTLKYIFSMAYVAPAPYFAYNVFDNGSQISSGNPGLQPERATSNEVNASWQDTNLLLSASAYYNHQSALLIISQSENAATVVLDPVFTTPDGTGATRKLTRSINLGTSNALGVDLFGRYNGSFLALWGSYSFVDFRQKVGDGPESGLPQISRHNVRLGASLKILSSLTLTPSLVLRSTPDNLTPFYEDPGVSLKTPYELNVNLLYTPFDYLDAFITARNLTDHRYALRGVSGPAPQEPIWALFGLRFRY